MGDWLANTVVEEMARRLRGADLWDNSLGDGLALLNARMETLERACRFEGYEYQKIKRPLSSWADAHKLLVVLASSRLMTFSDQPACVSDCLALAVLLDRWERADVPLPADIRVMMAGTIAIEWEKPYRVAILDRGQIAGHVPGVSDGR